MGKKVIIPCNELGQPIDDAGGLLGGFLGDLGSDYAKFPICYKTWCKVPVNYKNTVYDNIIQEEIERIESQDGISKKISELDSLARVLGKEHHGRVRGVGYGPCPTKVFGQTTNQFSGVSSAHASRDRNVEEMKLKVQKLEALVESGRCRSWALGSFLAKYLVQPGMELPAELANMFNALASEEGKWTNVTGVQALLPNQDVESQYD